jgi:hypothetical protein
METQVLEGTISEVQRQLSDLPCAPDTRVRVTIEEAGPKTAAQQTRDGITLVPENTREAAGRPADTSKPFRPTEFRYGVPLLPRRETAEPLTTEFVKRLLDGEDEEWLRAYRSGGC